MYKIGQTLIHLRNKSGKTQKQIADLLEVSDKTLGHWENDKREPSYEMLGKLAQIYQVTIGELFGETSERNATPLLIDKIIDDLIEEKVITEAQSMETLDPVTKQLLTAALNKHISDLLKKKSL